MSPSVARTVLRKVFAVADGWVSFVFQGGEPTLAGLDFFKSFVALCSSYNIRCLRVNYALQTNGLLLDDAFCDFLAKNRFLVGLSFDGTAELHDALRSRSAETLAAAERLKKAGADFNILTVVTSELSHRGQEVYLNLRKLGFDYLQFIPCLPPEGGRFGEGYAPSATEYGRFLCETFDLWLTDIKRGRPAYIRYFDNLLSAVGGQPPELCFMRGRCANQTVIESDGSVYPCDFYVDSEHCLGNISDGIPRIFSKSCDFTAANEPSAVCKACNFTYLCHGGCRRERDESCRTGLCDGFKLFFEHAVPMLKEYISRKK